MPSQQFAAKPSKNRHQAKKKSPPREGKPQKKKKIAATLKIVPEQRGSRIGPEKFAAKPDKVTADPKTVAAKLEKVPT